MTAKSPELAVSLRRQKIASSETARLGEIAREKAGKLTVIAGTGDAGDKVKVELSPYDLTRGRITYREK